jgi:hypothetical protein
MTLIGHRFVTYGRFVIMLFEGHIEFEIYKMGYLGRPDSLGDFDTFNWR